MAKLNVRVQPGAKNDEIVSFEAGVLRVRIRARAHEGKANEALVSYLAKELGLPKRGVSIVAGPASRDKVVLVEELEVEDILAILKLPRSPA